MVALVAQDDLAALVISFDALMLAVILHWCA